jgi:hypothetical protein
MLRDFRHRQDVPRTELREHVQFHALSQRHQCADDLDQLPREIRLGHGGEDEIERGIARGLGVEQPDVFHIAVGPPPQRQLHHARTDETGMEIFGLEPPEVSGLGVQRHQDEVFGNCQHRQNLVETKSPCTARRCSVNGVSYSRM